MMFQAHESVAEDFMGLLGGDGYTYWRMVERHHRVPWFHVSVMLVHDDGVEHRILMPDDVQMLEHILSLQASDVQIADIQVVMPPWMTGRDSWTMAQLMELKLAKGRRGMPIILYTVENGTVYHDAGGSPEREIDPAKEIRLIYRRPCPGEGC